MNILLNNEEKSHLLLSTFLHASIVKKGKIDLSDLNIDRIPSSVVNILLSMSLTKIDLRNNQIDEIPAELCDMETIHIDGNPLKLIPKEYRIAWPKLQKYLQYIRDRSASWRERKVIVVGEEATGLFLPPPPSPSPSPLFIFVLLSF